MGEGVVEEYALYWPEANTPQIAFCPLSGNSLFNLLFTFHFVIPPLDALSVGVSFLYIFPFFVIVCH